MMTACHFLLFLEAHGREDKEDGVTKEKEAEKAVKRRQETDAVKTFLSASGGKTTNDPQCGAS